MEFNINNRVKVKLNEKGLEILKKQSEELRARLPSFPEFKPPKTDDDGFSRWQMWELMGRFGEHISLGVSVPFETTIHFDEPDEITTLRQRLEQAEARCAKLESENESLWETFVKVSDYLGIDNEAARKIPGKPSSVFRSAILRKQAEAVEAIEAKYRPYGLSESYTAFAVSENLQAEANRLRQQASDIESGGDDG